MSAQTAREEHNVEARSAAVERGVVTRAHASVSGDIESVARRMEDPAVTNAAVRLRFRRHASIQCSLIDVVVYVMPDVKDHGRRVTIVNMFDDARVIAGTLAVVTSGEQANE